MTSLFREFPMEAVEILRSLGVDLPDTSLIRADSDSLPLDDLILVLGPPQQPLCGIAVELRGDKSKDPAQLARDAVAGWLELECPFHVLLVTHDTEIADHYRKPVHTGLPGYTFQTLVYGPDDRPVVTSPQQVAAHPVIAAMGFAEHGRDPAVRSAYAHGVTLLPSAYRRDYVERTFDISPSDIQEFLKDSMSTTAWPLYTPFAKEHFCRGYAEGQVTEAARFLLLMLEARGLAVTEDLHTRITSGTDLAQLEAWTTRAANAATIQEVFA